MQVWRSLAEVPSLPGRAVVTIGNFDGVHIGHRYLFEEVRARAAASGASAIVLTFDPHPVHVLAPDRELKLLTPMAERLNLFAESQLDGVLVLPFDAEFAAMTAPDFVRQILVDRLRACEILVGRDFRFGYRAVGDVELLRTMGAEHDFRMTPVTPLEARGGIVSSTRIRKLIAAGSVSAAARLLGRPYSVVGAVVSGRGIGTRATVPTLNMAPYPELLPLRGVYVTRTECNGFRGQSVTNIGRNPTVGETELHLESHFLDAPPPGWTHGEEMRVTFLFRIREEIKFPSVEALRQRIGRDIQLARKYFARAKPGLDVPRPLGNGPS
jgi:riboflavin kinase/FMN adenylyltransferase